MVRHEATDITIISGHTRITFYEDYPEALRVAVGLVRDGVTALEINQIGTLHTYQEILEASDALDENFTDEDLIEEVHHASRKTQRRL